jgi:hypothetical protein
MNAGQKQTKLAGSTRHRLPNAEVVGEVPSAEFRVTVTVRRRHELPSIDAQSQQKPGDRTYMTHAEHADKHGADPADIAKVEAFATENGPRPLRSQPVSHRFNSLPFTISRKIWTAPARLSPSSNSAVAFILRNWQRISKTLASPHRRV